MRVSLIQEIDPNKEAKITIKVQKMRPHGLRAHYNCDKIRVYFFGVFFGNLGTINECAHAHTEREIELECEQIFVCRRKALNIFRIPFGSFGFAVAFLYFSHLEIVSFGARACARATVDSLGASFSKNLLHCFIYCTKQQIVQPSRFFYDANPFSHPNNFSHHAILPSRGLCMQCIQETSDMFLQAISCTLNVSLSKVESKA